MLSMRPRLCTICRNSKNRRYLVVNYLLLILKWNKLFLHYIITYTDAVGHIFAKTLANSLANSSTDYDFSKVKPFDFAKVVVGRKLIQCSHRGGGGGGVKSEVSSD